METRRFRSTAVLSLAIVAATIGCALVGVPAEAAGRLPAVRSGGQAHLAIEPVGMPSPNLDTPEGIELHIRAVFGQSARGALCIAGAESGWRADALNVNDDSSRDRGVFQINSRWHGGLTDGDAFDAATNVAYAFRLSDGGRNWSAWSAVTRKRCGFD